MATMTNLQGQVRFQIGVKDIAIYLTYAYKAPIISGTILSRSWLVESIVGVSISDKEFFFSRFLLALSLCFYSSFSYFLNTHTCLQLPLLQEQRPSLLLIDSTHLTCLKRIINSCMANATTPISTATTTKVQCFFFFFAVLKWGSH